MDEYVVNFDTAKKEVKTQLNMQPISPIELPHLPTDTWEQNMKRCIEALMQCDCLYALHNWTSSEGAKIEVELAKQLGYKIYFENENGKVFHAFVFKKNRLISLENFAENC